MTRNAERLVARLKKHGVVVHPLGNTAIFRDQRQEALNRNAGEHAPTWVLRTDVLHRSGRTWDGGRAPAFDFEGERFDDFDICSHLPVTHLLRLSDDQWELQLEPRRARLFVDGPPPAHWT